VTLRHKLLAALLVVVLAAGFGYFVLQEQAPPQQQQQAGGPVPFTAEGDAGAPLGSGWTEYIAVGTGGVTGVYYPAGGAVCKSLNRERTANRVRCFVESTEGSIHNLQALRAGELHFGIVQSDWQQHAYKGTGRFADAGPFEGLRAVFALHPEVFTLLARAETSIAALDDLRGRRVNVGNPGSGQRATMEVVMTALGWDLDVFAAASELASIDQAQALCSGQVDAIVFTVGHPNGSIAEATGGCDSRLVPVTGPAIDDLVVAHPYYSSATIPGGLYRGNPEPVASFGLVATLVTTDAVPEPVVYALVKAVFDDFPAFRAQHPAFETLLPEAMIGQGLTAPLHPGAARYYREKGWI
jgi:hypothetical protein